MAKPKPPVSLEEGPSEGVSRAQVFFLTGGSGGHGTSLVSAQVSSESSEDSRMGEWKQFQLPPSKPVCILTFKAEIKASPVAVSGR